MLFYLPSPSKCNTVKKHIYLFLTQHFTNSKTEAFFIYFSLKNKQMTINIPFQSGSLRSWPWHKDLNSCTSFESWSQNTSVGRWGSDTEKGRMTMRTAASSKLPLGTTGAPSYRWTHRYSVECVSEFSQPRDKETERFYLYTNILSTFGWGHALGCHV